jgi:hypothetical protein
MDHFVLILDCICGKKQVPVTYVKTKAGFFKVCQDCRDAMDNKGLLIEPDFIHAMSE